MSDVGYEASVHAETNKTYQVALVVVRPGSRGFAILEYVLSCRGPNFDTCVLISLGFK